MQNAHRRKQLEHVELERAEVKDESTWEVGQEIKDAWGIGKETQKECDCAHPFIDRAMPLLPPSVSVEYESSYLPFLFPAEQEDVANHSRKPLGRRMFNRRGEDVSQPRAQDLVSLNIYP
jgi:hypothetical protein